MNQLKFYKTLNDKVSLQRKQFIFFSYSDIFLLKMDDIEFSM